MADEALEIEVAVVAFDTRVIPATFDDWYAETAPKLLASMTLLTGEPHAASDATAEAMARALEHWRRVRMMNAPDGWAYRVAVNVWKRQHRRSTLGRAIQRATAPRAPSSVIGGLPIELRQVIAALPVRQREVLVLRLVLQLSQAETSSLLGIAEGTVASTLSDAKRSMRSVLQPDEPEVTT